MMRREARDRTPGGDPLWNFSRRRSNAQPIALAAVACCVWLGSAALRADEPIAPGREPIELFNGRDLAGFKSYLKETGQRDPDGVFSVVDGTIRVSGRGAGYLATDKAYRDYRLSLEYRWGSHTDGSGFVRNSGVLVHQVNDDRVWPTSIEIQLAQGCEGDLIVIPGVDSKGGKGRATLTSDTRIASDGKTRWANGGQPTRYSGKQFWWSRHEPGFAEKLDTRGRDDVASPLGEWTRVEIIARGARLTVRINDVTVNEAYDVEPAAGRILLQNEGNEVFFRRVRLRSCDAE